MLRFVTLTHSLSRVICAVAVVVAATPVLAADYWPLITTDINDGTCDFYSCSLREAVIAANEDGEDSTIYLQAATYTLSIAGTQEDAAATGDLDVTQPLTIIGEGPGVSIIDAGGTDRVLHSLSGLSLKGLTVTGGGGMFQGGDGGGGIWHQGDILDIDSCAIVGNSTGSVGELDGGGVNHDGQFLYVGYSTIADNSATGYGGGIFVGPDTMSAWISRSTFSGNSAVSFGGGIFSAAHAADTSNCTFSLNTLSGEGQLGTGIANFGSLDITSSTLFQPAGAAFYVAMGSDTRIRSTAVIGHCERLSPITSYSGNLESPGDTCSFLAGDDLTNVADPQIGALVNHGGATLTHRFAATSPAIDFITGAVCNGLSPDQRSVDRPQDGDGDGGAGCDIGALENYRDGLFVHNFESGYATGWSVVVD